MKKITPNIISLLLIVSFLLTSCFSSTRKNELIFRFTPMESSVSLDSLKSEILGSAGTEMFVVYPDSDIVIIHYDRFKTHQDVIEEHFKECGYKITLLEKNKINEKEQPWQKK